MAIKKVGKLSKDLGHTTIKSYPVPNQGLQNSTDYLKNTYLKMLAVLLQQPLEIHPSQECLFIRIVEGAKAEYSVQDYVRQALEVDIKEFEEFVSHFTGYLLRFRFILDAVLLCFVSKAEKSQIQLLAAYIEALALEKEEIQYLLEAAKYILEQDVKGYMEREELLPNSIPDNYFQEYLALFATGKETVVHNSEERLWIKCFSKQELDLEPYIEKPDDGISKYFNNTHIRQKRIYIENIKYKLPEGGGGIFFDNNKKVIFKNCEFVGGDNYFVLCDVKYVFFLNCHFIGFTKGVVREAALLLNRKYEFHFEHCIFENCRYQYKDYQQQWGELGVIVSKEYEVEHAVNYFSECEFRSCVGLNNSYTYKSAILCQGKAEVYGCKFVDCWNYHDTNKIDPAKIDPDDPKRTLFQVGTLEVDSTVINSAKVS